MNATHSSPQDLSDDHLIAEVARLATRERRATADLLRALMEFDVRRLYLGTGHPSLFAYCTRVLNYSEHAALNRIEVARAARQFSALLDCIANGTLHLTGARVLAPHLTKDNQEEVLQAARHKSKREIEELVAGLNPRPPVAPSVRKLPVPAAAPPVIRRAHAATPLIDAPSAVSASPSASTQVPSPSAARTINPEARPVVEPLAPERYKVQFTISHDTRDRLRQVQDLMRHTLPNGDLAAIFDRALAVLLEQLQQQRFAAASKPRCATSSSTNSRNIPAAVKRAVWQRDGGSCAFVGTRGRCGETGFLEFHHVHPFAVGGDASVDNIELRCRAHNQHEATLFFGDVVRESSVARGATRW